MEFLSGEDDGMPCGGDAIGRFRDRKRECLCVALLGRQRTILARQNLGEHHVARNFDIDGAACAARQRPVDLARRGFRIIQNGGSDGQFLEYLLLCIEGAPCDAGACSDGARACRARH